MYQHQLGFTTLLHTLLMLHFIYTMCVRMLWRILYIILHIANISIQCKLKYTIKVKIFHYKQYTHYCNRKIFKATMSLYSIMKALCSSPYTKGKVFIGLVIASHRTKATALVTLTRILACSYTCLRVKAILKPVAAIDMAVSCHTLSESLLHSSTVHVL